MKKILIIFIMLFFVKVNASIIVMDADSGRVLFEKNIHERKLIASTTKIMTSIIALENAPLNYKIKVGDEIDSAYGSMIYVKKGEEFTLNDLLHGLMLRSGNDAAMIIANNINNYELFIAKMNLKALSLGMYDTFYENPHGLDEKTKNYSTAYDLALLMKYAIKNKNFVNITSQTKYSVGSYTWYNKNKLLSEYKYLISGKIGYTKKSGQVFVSAAKKDNKTLIIASIDESDKFNLHKKLYEEFFQKYNRYKVLDKYTFSFKESNTFNHFYILNDYYVLLKENEMGKIKIVICNNDYLKIFFDNKVIHQEKIYKKSYNERMKSIKEMLLFK